MRLLLACMAILAAFNVTAQVDGFQLPYNPDSEPDGYIGVADVLEVLSIFGSQFNPDDIYTNEDGTHVVMNVGSMTYPECEYTCQFTLPGSWRVATMADAGGAWPSIRNDGAWINQDDTQKGLAYTQVRRWAWSSGGSTSGHATGSVDFDDIRSCYCATQERPKVEYSICVGYGSDAWTEVEECGQLKVADGWYPLGSNDGASQAFWRWAD